MPLKLPKSKLAIGGIVVGAGVGGLWLYSKHKAASAAAAPSSSAFGYGYGYGGYGYNNPAFAAASTPIEYGYGQYGYGYYGYGGEFAGLGGYGSPTPPISAPSVASTNAGWAAASETYLTGQTGADPATVAAALGKYITGQNLSTAEQSIAEQAIAFEGYPPTAGANNYPPNMHTSPATGQGGGTGTTPAGTRQVQADGKQDLSQFAHAHNTTGGKLIALKGNKWLATYYGTTRKIPKGYKVTIQG
jgi:hypothetical protein